jgi:nucleoside-triphosphatase THEP1
MAADVTAFGTVGAAILRTCTLCPDPWAAVDEIGCLEQASPRYQAALLELFDTKRVLAVLRKADTPLLCALRSRSDCLVLDLDGWEE